MSELMIVGLEASSEIDVVYVVAPFCEQDSQSAVPWTFWFRLISRSEI